MQYYFQYRVRFTFLCLYSVFCEEQSATNSEAMSRSIGLSALKKNRDLVGTNLEQALQNSQDVIDNPVDENNCPRISELKRCKRILKQHRDSYQTLSDQFLRAIEQQYPASGKSEQETQLKIDSEYTSSFSFISKADDLLCQLTGLQEEFSDIEKANSAAAEKAQAESEIARKQRLEDEEILHRRTMEERKLALEEDTSKQRLALEVERLKVAE